ncbi:MAG: DUF2784 domain-containing protein [Proteobacteria bacterium]|nr:DUF2784 domain-containing protein [Pseudomonadota bacterium]
MWFRFLADILAVFHFSFIIFAVLGCFLSIWWRRIIWFHIPAVVLAALIEFTGWICPLTPLENLLRIKGGEAGYPGGFVKHYIFAIVYPPGLTREIQVALGVFVVAINLLIYCYIFIARKPKPSWTKNIH